MNQKENEVIKQVSDMLNKNEFVPRDELLAKTGELGWKPVTLNFALSRLKKGGFVVKKENSFKLIKDYTGSETMQVKNNSYRPKKRNYQREIPELTEDQAEFKEKVLAHRDELFDSNIVWVDGNGTRFPLRIAGMGDVTIRCRFFLSDFMDSEPQTGALVYIPWHDKRISQLYDQVDELLSKTEDLPECVNFAVAPAK